MAIGWASAADFLKRRFLPRRASMAQAPLEMLLRRAAEEDGLSRAPDGLAERVAAAVLTAPAARPAAVDLSGFLLRPRVVCASLVSFSAGAALAVCLIDIQAGALVKVLLLGVTQSITTGGYL